MFLIKQKTTKNNIKVNRLTYIISAAFIFFTVSHNSQNKNIVGEWSKVIPLPLIPVAMANLPNGKVLCWSAYKSDMFSFENTNDGTILEDRKLTQTCIFDPDTEIATPRIVTETGHDMFCPAINNCKNGDVLVSGGQHSTLTSTYNWMKDKWENGPSMINPRGYHSSTTLSDDSFFTIGGSWAVGGVKAFVDDPNSDAEFDRGAEIMAGTNWKITPNITSAKSIMEGTEPNVPRSAYTNEKEYLDDLFAETSAYRRDNHAWIWEAPNSKIFHAGPGSKMHWIDPRNKFAPIASAGDRGTDKYAMNGAAVMYDIGKIFKIGGAESYSSNSPATKNAYKIDINNDNVLVEDITQVNNEASKPRSMVNAVALPTGEVFVVGGLNKAAIFTDQDAVLAPELWSLSGATATVKELALMKEPRTYHSTAILLMDGRVLVGGGGLYLDRTINHLNVEIFSPPYLFDSNNNIAVRPLINSAPKRAFNENTFTLAAEANITEFALVRMSSVTHSVNNEQRRVPLTFTSNVGRYTINVPKASIAIPGYYMLFAIKNGVPSIAKAIQILPKEETATVNIQYPYLNGKYNVPGIIEAENYDDGGPQIAYYDLDINRGDANYRKNEGVDVCVIKNVTPLNHKICYGRPGEWLEYTFKVSKTDGYNVALNLSSKIEGGILVAFNYKNGFDNHKVLVKPTGGFDNFAKHLVKNEIWLREGLNTMSLKIVSGNFDIDSIEFTPTPRSEISAKEGPSSHHSDVSANSTETKSTISLSPNPAKDFIFVSGLHAPTKLEIFDINGVKMQEIDKATSAKIKGLKVGTYILFAEGYPAVKFIKK